MGDLAATAGTYGRLVGGRIRADWQYRTSFVLFLVGQTLVAGFEFASLAVLFTNVDALAGWSALEVAFLYGVSGLAFGVADLFISQVETAAVHIKAGTFDHFLVRPLGPLLQLSAAEFAPRRLGRSVQPAIVLAVVLGRLDVDWTAAHVALVPLTIASAVVIYGAIWVATSSIAFWTVETQEVANSFTYGGNELTSYPIDVLGRWLRRAVTFVVPLASIAYLPACQLFAKPLPFGLPRAAAWAGPIVAVVAVAGAGTIWRTAVRHYRSTGS